MLPFSRLSPLLFPHFFSSFFFILPQPKPLFPSLNPCHQTHLYSPFFVLSSWVCVDQRSCGVLVWSVDRRSREHGLKGGSKRGSDCSWVGEWIEGVVVRFGLGFFFGYGLWSDLAVVCEFFFFFLFFLLWLVVIWFHCC